MKIEEVVGARLREAREAAGISQEELGRSLGRYLPKPWPGQLVSVAEDGGRKFSASELFALCMLLSRPASYFFIPIGDRPIDVAGMDNRVDVDVARALQVWGAEENWNLVAPLLYGLVSALPKRLYNVEQNARVTREIAENIARIMGTRDPDTDSVEAIAEQLAHKEES